MEEKRSTDDKTERIASSNRRMHLAILFGVIGIVLLVGGGFLGVELYRTYFQDQRATPRSSVENDGNKVVTQDEAAIADVVTKVSPSVVSILTTTPGDGFNTAAQEGAGTGIIVSADGYIMTNKHVIDGTDSASVVLSDGSAYENVEVVGADPLNDVAFLKIKDASGLAAVELGDSSSVRVGQEVVAIGNSLGLYQNTVTTGIISGTGRPISAQDGSSVQELNDLIQTDAAINPGNSGGPLLNLSGQVIGINTAIVEGAQGIGFAIPINAAKGVLKGVVAGKGVLRGYLGVQYVTITASVAKEYNLPVKQGAYLKTTGGSAIVKDGPAAKAGLKDGDIITKVNGLVVGEAAGLSSLVAEYAPGDVIELTILRNGSEQMIKVTLGQYNS